MNEHKQSGIHCVFYYYGAEHLAINIYDYVNKGIKKNELVYLCVEPEIYKTIFKYLQKHNNQIEILNIACLINKYNTNDIEELLTSFSSYKELAREKGYSSIRIVNQVNYLLSSISQDQFMDFDNLLNKVVEKLNISVMCAYDFDDYLNKKQLIDDTLMNQSFRVHDHRFYNFRMIKNNGCI